MDNAVLKYGIELFGTLCENMLFFWSVYSIFSKKVKYRVQILILLIICSAFITTICNYIDRDSYWTPVIGILLWSIGGRILFQIPYIKILAVAGFFMMWLGYFEACMMELMIRCCQWTGSYDAFAFDSGNIRLRNIVVLKLSEATIVLLCRKPLGRIQLRKKYAWFLLGVDIIGMTILIGMSIRSKIQYPDNTPQNFLLAAAGVLFAACIAYFSMQNKEERMKVWLSEERNKLLEENYQALNELYAKNAKLYHDLNNHLAVLHHLAEEKLVDEIQAYIETVSEPVRQLKRKLWTGNEVIDIIIEAKRNKAKSIGSDMDINVEFRESMGINPAHVSTILANLLDNALEEIQTHEKPEVISLTMRRISGFYMIQISNPSREKKKTGDIFKTTKENKELHGWGLQNVEDAAEKYHGVVQSKCEDGRFTVSVMLFPDRDEKAGKYNKS